MKRFSSLRRQRAMYAHESNHADASTSLRGSNRSIVGRLRTLHSGEEGQAILETALCLVFIVLPLIFALFFMGLYIAYYQDLTQAVGAAGVRVGSDRGVSTDPCADALSTILTNSPLNLTSANLTLTIKFNGAIIGGNSCPGQTLGGVTPGGTAIVSASYKFGCPMMKFGGLQKIVCSPVGAQVTEYVY